MLKGNHALEILILRLERWKVRSDLWESLLMNITTSHSLAFGNHYPLIDSYCRDTERLNACLTVGRHYHWDVQTFYSSTLGTPMWWRKPKDESRGWLLPYVFCFLYLIELTKYCCSVWGNKTALSTFAFKTARMLEKVFVSDFAYFQCSMSLWSDYSSWQWEGDSLMPLSRLTLSE